MKLSLINETLIEYQFSNNISLELSNEILSIYQYFIKNLDYEKLGLIEIRPGFTTISIAFKSCSPLFDDPDYLRNELLQARALPVKMNSKTHTIDIIYNGMDIESVCQSAQLTRQELIEAHQKCIYTIAMLGFKGNFPYLLGLDQSLILPRRASPRNLVKKGSVAIGSNQCGIYAEDSPGGWHIIANTDFDDFDALKAGDKIIFKKKPKHHYRPHLLSFLFFCFFFILSTTHLPLLTVSSGCKADRKYELIKELSNDVNQL